MAYVASRFVDRDMLLRHHWGLGVGHTYSHVRGPSNENQPFTSTRTETHSVVQTDSSDVSAMPASSTSQGQPQVSLDDNPDAEFSLPCWDDEELEWETPNSGSSSEEEESDYSDDAQTMHALYSGEANYD